jgi:hypothetical protein
MQSLVSWRQGRVADVAADCSLALDIGGEARGAHPLSQAARGASALAAIARDADVTELRAIEAALQDPPDPDALPFHLVLHARGVLRVHLGDLEAGTADLLECGRVSLGWGQTNPTVVPWRSDAALALARAGDQARAEGLAREELELAERFGARVRSASRSERSRWWGRRRSARSDCRRPSTRSSAPPPGSRRRAPGWTWRARGVAPATARQRAAWP